jgi:hypothetical protein
MMTISLTLAGKAIRKRLRRVILGLAQPKARPTSDVPPVFYRFPPF